MGESPRGAERTGRAAKAPERGGTSHWAGEPIRVLEQRWGVPFLEAHETLGSTNDRIRSLAADGALPYSVVVAEEQTAGRGRGGSSWVSPSGIGVWMSVLLPGEGGGRPPLTPLLVGLAVVRAIQDRGLSIRAGLKWPNDVEVKGRKICGILCEGAPSGATIAGIGINVTGQDDRFPPELRGRATTLEAAAGERPPARPDLVASVLSDLRKLTDPVPHELGGQVARELQRLDVLRGRRIRTSTGVVGRGMGIDATGALLVAPDTDEGMVRVVAGSVRRTG